MGDRACTTGFVARCLGVSRPTVVKLCESGLLDCYRIPGSGLRRVPLRSLIRYAERNAIALPPACYDPPSED